ncbi:Hsp70 family protein [Planotetraspora kaengkrachanensis]|uniref:Chaperone protein DnaK n=1 Tax=Planotetraspora kaengkrachanensis TaxID=575193 RepID=A0A8J3LUD5_9ACTN|nr:Hsp70 family protein [Planotetraspora kaengkrachanensis]GIG79313.1 chaperone protein DnaK [Planotetraspora kaengkrachanensis]
MGERIWDRRKTRRVVGIDLGTTESAVAILRGGSPSVVVNAEGARTTPSVVAFTDTGEVLVGGAARRQAVVNPGRTVRSVKRLMGTGRTVEIDGRTFAPQQISAFILRKLKEDAEARLGESVTGAVITVPVCFGEPERRTTREAGEIAGLNVLRIANEPVAAAMAHRLNRLGAGKEQTVLVFDLGGGTYDVSLLDVGPRGVHVRAASGDARLGGDDWDRRLVDELLKRYRVLHDVDMSGDEQALRRLAEAAERARIELSDRSQTSVHTAYRRTRQGFPSFLDQTLTRGEFELITADLLDRCRAPFHQVVKQAGVRMSDVAHVVLAGGATRMPAFSALVRELTGREPIAAGPDEAVVLGAALLAGAPADEPAERVPANRLTSSIGIETRGGTLTPVIERGTVLPASRAEIFTTAEDAQESIKIAVFQGNDGRVASATELGRYEVTGIVAAPRGRPQIEITFAVDAGGLFSVSARDLGTGRPQPMTRLDGPAGRR